MNKIALFTALFGIMVALTGTVTAGEVGKGVVVLAGSSHDYRFAPKLGDIFVMSQHVPTTDAFKGLGFPQGRICPMMMVRKESNDGIGAGVQVYWSTDKPEFQQKMFRQSGKITGVGSGLSIQSGDTVTIQSQSARDGGRMSPSHFTAPEWGGWEQYRSL